MGRFVEGATRNQATLLPERLEDFIAEDNPVWIVDAFVDELQLASLEFDGATPAITGRPSYHPAMLLKIYIYGYLNRVQSSRRLERECQRNVELMWLTSRLATDFKTIAEFRRSNGPGIRNVYRRFVVMCRDLKLFTQAVVTIDGSKFKAVNSHDNNFTPNKIAKRQEQIGQSIQRYLDALETADRTQPAEVEAKTERLREKIETLREQMRDLDHAAELLNDLPGKQVGASPTGRSARFYTASAASRPTMPSWPLGSTGASLSDPFRPLQTILGRRLVSRYNRPSVILAIAYEGVAAITAARGSAHGYLDTRHTKKLL